MKLKIFLLALSFNESNKGAIFNGVMQQTKRIFGLNRIESEIEIISHEFSHPEECIEIINRSSIVPPPKRVLYAECVRQYVDKLNFDGQKVAITSWPMWLEYAPRVKAISYPGKTAVVVSLELLKNGENNTEVLIKRCANTIVHELVHNRGVEHHHSGCIMLETGEPKEIDTRTELICESCRQKIQI